MDTECNCPDELKANDDHAECHRVLDEMNAHWEKCGGEMSMPKDKADVTCVKCGELVIEGPHLTYEPDA